jgi:hypothetical protein
MFNSIAKNSSSNVILPLAPSKGGRIYKFEGH